MKNAKRVMGTTLAALTVMAGMSAVAFAGEPNHVSYTDLAPAGENVRMMKVVIADSTEAIEVTEACQVEIKVDEKTGEKMYSLDGGKTWSKLVDGETVGMEDLVSVRWSAAAEVSEGTPAAKMTVTLTKLEK